MKMLGEALRRAVLIFPLMLFCLLSLALAEKRIPKSNPHPPTQASSNLITIRLTMPDNQVILATQYEYEMITLGPPDGEKLGITPHLLDNGAVALDFSLITNGIERGTVVGGSRKDIGSMELNSTLPQATPTKLIKRIEIIIISKAAEELGNRGLNKLSCPCCVSCDGQECCGLTVQMSCNSCSCL
ncbi:MAG TPA: hypothetical protein VGO47_11970 [Chlamydiales bacterium]|nr:hypothetical protein [Chlamydiales bacterium]